QEKCQTKPASQPTLPMLHVTYIFDATELDSCRLSSLSASFDILEARHCPPGSSSRLPSFPFQSRSAFRYTLGILLCSMWSPCHVRPNAPGFRFGPQCPVLVPFEHS